VRAAPATSRAPRPWGAPALAPTAAPAPDPAADLRRRVFGQAALLRSPEGEFVVSPSARRTLNDLALAAGELVTLDELAAVSGIPRPELLAAVAAGELEPAPGDDRLRLLFSHFECCRFISLRATGEGERHE
jgi:hypothetical protein